MREKKEKKGEGGKRIHGKKTDRRHGQSRSFPFDEFVAPELPLGSRLTPEVGNCSCFKGIRDCVGTKGIENRARVEVNYI